MVVPPKHPKMIIFSRKTLVVEYHHFRKLPFGWSSISCVSWYPMCLASTSVAAFDPPGCASHWSAPSEHTVPWSTKRQETDGTVLRGNFVEDCQGKIGATAISKLETWAGEEHILRQWAMDHGPYMAFRAGISQNQSDRSTVPNHLTGFQFGMTMAQRCLDCTIWKPVWSCWCLKPVGRWITLTCQWLPCWELGPKTSAPSTASSGVEQNSALSSCASWRCDGDSMVMLGFPWFPYNLLHTVCQM